jgi:acetyl-CoA synthetase
MLSYVAEIAWRPTPEHLARSRLLKFARAHGHEGYDGLHAWAVADPGAYWAAVEKELGVKWRKPYDQPLDLSEGKPFARFFAGGRLNYVETILAHPSERLALIYESEEGETRQLTYGELRDDVGRAASHLRALGISKGDRVGIFMPLTPECAVATLACSAVGAIFAPIFSGYGAEAVATRLKDAEAKLLIAGDGFPRRGKQIAMREVAEAAKARAPSVERLLVVGRGQPAPWADQPTALELADTSADDPYMLIYTSGTTGKPKGTVHIHGGFPIKAAHDLAYCFDGDENDRIFWYTDVGWVMGPWLFASALMLGATAVLYDGAVDFPEADRIWAVAEGAGATVLGFSPTGVRAMMRQPLELVRRHDLSSLRALGSTGEPWNEDPWWWYFKEVGGGRCPIVNFSGGTEASGGMISGLMVAPCAPCAFNGPTPDMALDVVDEKGNSVRGQVGELVVRGPWVGMTQGFWRDRQRYLDTYWSTWPDVWHHGDFARADEDGFWYILGRSDDTIKLAGKRVGPAEVESAAVSHPAVAEAGAVGVPDELKGESLVLFAVLRPGVEPTDVVRKEIADAVVSALGPTVRPAVRFTTELPKTRNAKVLRRAIRGAHLRIENLGDLSSLENPGALDAIRASS